MCPVGEMGLVKEGGGGAGTEGLKEGRLEEEEEGTV